MTYKTWYMEIKFELRDMWVGLYWTPKELPPPVCWHFYICPLPCLLIHIYQENVSA